MHPLRTLLQLLPRIATVNPFDTKIQWRKIPRWKELFSFFSSPYSRITKRRKYFPIFFKAKTIRSNLFFWFSCSKSNLYAELKKASGKWMENPFRVRHVFFLQGGTENVFTFLSQTFSPPLMDFFLSLYRECVLHDIKASNFPQRVTHNPTSEFNRFPFQRSREFCEGKCWHQTENANDPNDIRRNVHFVCLRHDSRYVPTIWTFLDFYDSPFRCSNVLFNALPSNKIPRLLFSVPNRRYSLLFKDSDEWRSRAIKLLRH